MQPLQMLSALRRHPTKLSLEDRYWLSRQLHVLHKAGVPLLSSLRALEEQLPAGALKQSVRLISQDLLQGHTLSQAFARRPESFDQTFVGMIQVGEAGGLLEEILKRLAELFEWEQELRSKVKQALQYPAIVLLTLAVALSIMLTFVLPRFAQFFGTLKVQLPLQTRLVLAASKLLLTYGWVLGVGLVVGAVVFWRYIRTEPGRLWWHKTLLRLPILGPLFLQLGMSRFTRTTSALSASGMPILETLALAGESVNNRYIQQGLEKVRDRVKGGEALASALKTDGLFPPVVVQMVATGEETGQMDELLRSVSDYYDQQATYLLRKLITYVEPALLIIVGLGVLLMASSVLVPMWDLVKVLKQTGG
jgi:MSHA biogenesis protein MshG